MHGGAKDAGGVAGRSAAGLWRHWKHAAKAGCRPRHDRHGRSTTAQNARVDPWSAVRDAVIVHEIASFEVVGAVDHDICASKSVTNRLGGEVDDSAADIDFRVDGREPTSRGRRLRQMTGDVRFIEERLSLEV